MQQPVLAAQLQYSRHLCCCSLNYHGQPLALSLTVCGTCSRDIEDTRLAALEIGTKCILHAGVQCT